MFEAYVESLPVPDDHSKQFNAFKVAEDLFRKNVTKSAVVLDLGCGEGNSVDFFRSLAPEVNWFGIDLESSPEVDRRKRKDASFIDFDGTQIPFENNYFDVIFCHQVLEHVKYPSILLKEVARVLKPNGYFVGSTSHLEPYHSLSTWNYTPYGFHLLLSEAGLEFLEVRPGIDALTLIIRVGLGRPAFFARWWNQESPLNSLIGFVGRLIKKNNRQINFAKLMFCGQFCFLATK